MGKHGESWENMETMENIESMGKIENINQKPKTACMATVEKKITYVLGEHYPGSAQDGRT